MRQEGTVIAANSEAGNDIFTGKDRPKFRSMVTLGYR